MTIEMNSGTLEARIIRILFDVYPITVDELARELRLKPERVEVALNRLVVKGIISFDVLPDKRYIRLQRRDIKFIGRKETQRKALKHTGRKKSETKDYDGPMYG